MVHGSNPKEVKKDDIINIELQDGKIDAKVI